jgi:type I restriction enzyme R subunit
VNETDEIQKAFRPYYEVPLVEQQGEPHQLYDLQAKLAAEQVYHSNEVEEFAKVFFKPKGRQSPSDHAQMHRILDFPVERRSRHELTKDSSPLPGDGADRTAPMPKISGLKSGVRMQPPECRLL